MAHASEDRLKKVMDKLYRAPRPRIPSLSRPGGGNVTASKGISVRELAPRAQVGKAQPCRPWDRGDLIRRLTTFKAMTWFGKPKDISPVNCARRGWINVEMDVIICEACGARLLFASPPSWSLQQVEKAAAVFSLKLDNGHKLLCPWINNVCDESLASFPPSPPQLLVEGFKERSHALQRLTTLPVISSLTFVYMKSSQLDRFLSLPFHTSITLNNGVSLIDDCRSKDQNCVAECDISHDYFQALKIISVCGWEPRSLPYTIDFDDQLGPSAKSTNLLGSSEEIRPEIQKITSCSSRSHNIVEGEQDNYPGEYLYDQSSTTLECRFCGACVGLWFFKSIPRPLEFFKIIIDGGRQSELLAVTADLAQRVDIPMVENIDRGDNTSNIGKSSGLQFSIAGGPPPNKQQFRPKVSFPFVSRYLRAELLYNSCYQQDASGKEDHVCLQKEFNGHHDDGQAGRSLKRKQCELGDSNSQLHTGGNHGDEGNSLAGQGRSGHTNEEILTPCNDVVVRETVPCQSNSPTSDARELIYSVSRLDQSKGSNLQLHVGGNHGDVNEGLADQSRSEHTSEGILSLCTNGVVKDVVLCQSDSPTTVPRVSNDSVSKLDQSNSSNSQFHVGGHHGDVVNLSAGEGMSEHTTEEILTPCTDIFVSESIPCLSHSPTTNATESNDLASRLDESNFLHTPENDHFRPLLSRLDESNCGYTRCDLSLSASSSITCVNSATHKTCEMDPCSQTLEQASAGKQVLIELAKEVSDSIAREENVDHFSGNGKLKPVADFDPIKQHRPFCPWISEGKNLPGWKAVLSALNNLENNTSQQPEKTAADSNFLDEIDDPIVSVRKLFISPPSKRFKANQ